MVNIDGLMAFGTPAELANAMYNGLQQSVSATVTAAGTTVTDATQLTAVFNNVSTAAASTGVKLWDPPVGTTTSVGQLIFVRNGGANDLKVYPPNSSGTINGGGAGAGVTLATATKDCAFFIKTAANTWIAMEAASSA
jgi:hypothetical protein